MAGGNLVDAPYVHVLAAAMAAGYVTAEPDTNASLYFHFNVATGSLADNTATIPVGTRVLTSRSDQQYWTEGSIQYFAETVGYTLKFNQSLAAALNSPGFTASFRLVLQHDPANGAWALSALPGRGTTFSAGDGQNLLGVMENYPTQIIVTDAQAARQRAFNEIAAQFLSSGMLARTDTPNVLTNPQAKIAFYTAPYDIPPNSTFDTVRSYCAGVSTPGFSGWHVPTYGELMVAFTGSGDSLRIRDAPDHQIWGGIFTSPNPNSVNAAFILVSDTFYEYGRPGMTDHWTGGPQDDKHDFMAFSVLPDGRVSVGSSGKWATSTQAMVVAFPDQQTARVICVARIP
jgi:hypothetical protein